MIDTVVYYHERLHHFNGVDGREHYAAMIEAYRSGRYFALPLLQYLEGITALEAYQLELSGVQTINICRRCGGDSQLQL